MKLWQASALAVAGILASSLSTTEARAESQPKMRAALTQLQAAKVQLETATHDKSGHRAKALGHVNAAIAEVKAGIAADNKSAERPKPTSAKTTTSTKGAPAASSPAGHNEPAKTPKK